MGDSLEYFSVRARRVLGSVVMAATMSLVAAGLTPAHATPSESTAEAPTETPSTRPDTVSAQITAKATGQRIEDLSQRSEKEQVFANPDGSWTSETSTSVRFAEKNGNMVPVSEIGTLESAGKAITGSGTELEIADGTASLGDGPTGASVPLATLTGTGEDKGKTLELGWEGKLPTPEVAENTATYAEGVEATVVDAPTDAAPESTETPEEAESSNTAAESAAADDPKESGAAQTAVDATVEVSPTRTGFSHLTVLNEAPEETWS